MANLKFSGEAWHKLFVGDTGSGKTTGMREGHANCDSASIWCNYNGVHNVKGSKVNTKGINTADELRYRMLGRVNEWEEITDIRLNVGKSSDWPAGKIVKACYLAARDIFDSTHLPVQLCIDEIHNFWDNDYESLEPSFGKHLYKEGRREGLFIAGTTQDPADLPNPALKQVWLWFWFGPPAGTHGAFLSNPKWRWMPVKTGTDPGGPFPESNHTYVAYDKHGVIYVPKGKSRKVWHTKTEFKGRF